MEKINLISSSSPPGSPSLSSQSQASSRRASDVSDDDVEYIPPTGSDIPNSYANLLYHYNKILKLYNRLKQRETVAVDKRHGFEYAAKECESDVYMPKAKMSVFKSEHQPPGMTRDGNGAYVIEHLNVIGSDDLKITPTDRVLGEGNFGVVKESSYHLAPVAVKRLKKDISDSALDEFVHETLMNVYALVFFSCLSCHGLHVFCFVTVSF